MSAKIFLLNKALLKVESDKLADSDFYSKAIIPYLQHLEKIKETVVLGDVN